jgi:hypothetical protein
MHLAELAPRGALFKALDLVSGYVDPTANVDGDDPPALSPSPTCRRGFGDRLQPSIEGK